MHSSALASRKAIRHAWVATVCAVFAVPIILALNDSERPASRELDALTEAVKPETPIRDFVEAAPHPQDAVRAPTGAPTRTEQRRPEDPPRMPPTSLLVGHVPASVSPDGSQVFDGIPCRIRQPDGTFKDELWSVKVRPVAQTYPVLDN